MVKVSVVGAGFWGRNHLRVLGEMDDCEVVGVCDVDEGRARAAALRHKVPRYFTGLDTLLRETRPDAVMICTPSTTHADLAERVLQEGVDVLIEKPMTTNVKDAYRIVGAVERTGRQAMVGFIERFNPAVTGAKKLLQQGEIGGIILSYSRRIGSWPERIGDVGVVGDTAIHDIDLTSYVFGELPLSVYAKGGALRHRLEDHVQASLSFSNGRSAVIEANWLTPRKKREMHITGDGGVISVRFLEQELTIEKADSVRTLLIKYEEPLKLELEHFLDCVRRRTKPMIDVLDGLRAAIVSDAIIHSIRTKSEVNIAEFTEKASES